MQVPLPRRRSYDAPMPVAGAVGVGVWVIAIVVTVLGITVGGWVIDERLTLEYCGGKGHHIALRLVEDHAIARASVRRDPVRKAPVYAR